MSMTKKDYELIANVINGCVKYDTGELTGKQMLVEVSYQLAEFLKQDNPRFDKNKFITACGI